MVILQIFLDFSRITRVRIPGESILSEIVSVFQTLGFEPSEAPDGDRQLRAAQWLRRGSPSCFSEQASYILKAYKACLGLNINIKILYLNRRTLDRKWGSRDSLICMSLHDLQNMQKMLFAVLHLACAWPVCAPMLRWTCSDAEQP